MSTNDRTLNHRQRLQRTGATGTPKGIGTELALDNLNAENSRTNTSAAPASQTSSAPAASAAPTSNATSTAAPVATAALSPHDHVTYQQLMQRRTRLEVLAGQAEEGLAACIQEAAKLGVSSLKELEALVKRLEEEEAAEMAAFHESMQKEKALLDQIERDLQQLGQG